MVRGQKISRQCYSREEMTRKFWAIVATGVSFMIFYASVFSLPEKLIWNRTNSAPIGLYWLSDGPLTLD